MTFSSPHFEEEKKNKSDVCEEPVSFTKRSQLKVFVCQHKRNLVNSRALDPDMQILKSLLFTRKNEPSKT